MALAEDTGNINILAIDDDFKIRSINYFKLNDLVHQLAVWENSSNVLSCSGRSVEIWEANSSERNPVEKFRYDMIKDEKCRQNTWIVCYKDFT